MQIISQQLLDSVSAAAQSSPRQRKNFNFHQRDDEVCHRLLNALEPDTYISPHCHRDETKGETLGIDIPPGAIHSLVALEKNSVFFESKAGPYVTLSEHERFSWAPIEGADAAREYLAWMKSQFA